MKKLIAIDEEVLVRLLEGKYVEGSLHRDKWTHVFIFNAYNRLPKNHLKDVLVKKLPWGWVKESMTRKKRYSSIPKDLTLEEQLAILDEENELAKQALIESYIIESV